MSSLPAAACRNISVSALMVIAGSARVRPVTWRRLPSPLGPNQPEFRPASEWDTHMAGHGSGAAFQVVERCRSVVRNAEDAARGSECDADLGVDGGLASSLPLDVPGQELTKPQVS
jgi:hypothetical protein